MDAQVQKTKAEETYTGQFEAGRAKLPGNAWVKGLRDKAYDRYSTAGLPHRRVEEWKYTDLRARLTEVYPPAPPLAEALGRADVDRALGDGLAAVDSHRLVIVDGQFRPELSDMDALAKHGEVLSVADALEAPPDWFRALLGQVNPQERDPVVSLNMALAGAGVACRIKEGAEIKRPVHVIHLHAARTEAGLATRSIISVGAGAKLTLLESYVALSRAPAQRNAVTELAVGEGAHVHHVKFQDEGGDSVHLSSWLTRLGAQAQYRAFQFSTGAALARNQIFVEFAGEGGLSHITSAFLGRSRQHNDTTIVVDHAAPGCESRELNKAVLDGEARGIVQCKVNVHRGAQKSDGHQMAHGLLLSERAEFDSKPELEIFADDVICGHGSTSGEVDGEHMFYLRSRGVSEDEARALLIAAFAREAIEKVGHEGLREAFTAIAESWLAAGTDKA